MAAAMIAAIDQHATRAHLAHFAERDLLRVGHDGVAKSKREQALNVT